MGRALTFEQGKLCIGRKVRMRMLDGGGGYIPGVLVAASKKTATFRPDNRGGNTKEVPWFQIEDWASHNPGVPLPKPTPVTVAPPKPATTSKNTEPKETTTMPTLPSVNDPTYVRASLQAALADADSVNLSEQITKAASDVRAAKQMVEEAKAELAKAQGRLQVLRDRAQALVAEIDKAMA